MKCSKCYTEKPIKDFPKDKSNSRGYKAFCKKCAYAMSIEWNRSKSGVIVSTWHHQVRHSITRGHIPPQYTKEQLSYWLLNNPDFHVLHTMWVESGYNKDLRPSVDRLDNAKGYAFDNIRLVTFRVNYTTYQADKQNGFELGDCKPIVKLSKEGEYVSEYHSVAEALRQHGKKSNNARISAVLTGNRKYYLSHRWIYKKDYNENTSSKRIRVSIQNKT